MRVPALLSEFEADIEAARNHLLESKWSNWMRYIHTADSDQDTCVMLTDFLQSQIYKPPKQIIVVLTIM